jgi:hypothetical protein
MNKEEIKKYAIEFVHFVLSNPLYKDMFNRYTIFPEEIYIEYLNQNKDE